MNGLEVLNHLLFVEPDKGLWGIILLGVVVAIGSLWFDKYNDSDNIPVNREWH